MGCLGVFKWWLYGYITLEVAVTFFSWFDWLVLWLWVLDSWALCATRLCW